MTIIFKLKNELGEFISEEMNITEQQYSNILSKSKNFYDGSGYEMYLPNGFMVVSPEIVRKSILIIEIIKL